jgi:zinc protease
MHNSGIPGLVWLVVLALLFGSPARAHPLEFNVQTHELTNGMKMLMLVDSSIPNIAMHLFYRVGSRNERPGITGISHYFEHMMFNGAAKYGPGMFDRVMEDNGGANNAFTSQDITAYQNWFPTPALPLIFDLESDRIRSLSFDPKMVESERGVVANERRLSVDNNNESLLNEQLVATAFTAHPYNWPVVGWASDIESWKREDLMQYFKTYYAPNNCVLVVVGQFDPTRTIALAREHLEPIPPQPVPLPVTTKEPTQLGERRLVVRKLAQLPILQLAYHGPSARDADFVPMSVLEYILLRGESSRLYHRLVDKEQVANSVAGGQSPHIDPYLFEFNIQPRAGVAPARVETVLYEELARVRTELVTERELQKAQNIALADFYNSMKAIRGKADLLGTYEVIFGDYRRLFSQVELIEKVTREDVRRVAQVYLDDRGRNVAVLEPEDQPETAERPAN